jgi:hypothetical protein
MTRFENTKCLLLISFIQLYVILRRNFCCKKKVVDDKFKFERTHGATDGYNHTYVMISRA